MSVMKAWLMTGLATALAVAIAGAALIERGSRLPATRPAPQTINVLSEDTGALERIASESGAQSVRAGAFRAASGRTFVLDRTGQGARLVFADTGETLELRESWGSGDVLFSDPQGRLVLRLTGRGNAILYAGGDTLGEPADAILPAAATAGPAPEAPRLKPASAG